MKDKNKLTFAELKKLVDSTRGVARPRARQLRLSGVKIVAQQQFQDGTRMTVYQCGFALCEMSGHVTVVRVDECGDYTYSETGSEAIVPQEFFQQEDWCLCLQLKAEERLERNQESRRADARRNDTSRETMENVAQPFALAVGDWMERKEAVEEILRLLTDRQRQVFTLYHLQGYTQMEIAQMLGVTRESITRTLAQAKKRLQKKIEK